MRFLTTAWGQLVPVVLEELDVEAGLEADSVAAGFDSLEDDPPVDDESPEGFDSAAGLASELSFESFESFELEDGLAA